MNTRLRTVIKSAPSLRYICDILMTSGYRSFSERIETLEDDMDYMRTPINLESVRKFVLFIGSNRRRMGMPEFNINSDGHVNAVWKYDDSGILSITFLPLGRVRFGAIIKSKDGGDKWKISDTSSVVEMKKDIKPFIYKFMKNDTVKVLQ